MQRIFHRGLRGAQPPSSGRARLTKNGADFNARWICPAAYILAERMRDPASEAALAKAFEKGDGRKVNRLYRTDNLPAERCWLQGSGWCLAYE
jgi:protein-L-isoaspartate(D-aspartate) O-methyltransferase